LKAAVSCELLAVSHEPQASDGTGFGNKAAYFSKTKNPLHFMQGIYIL
jgi:hypothetical protein